MFSSDRGPALLEVGCWMHAYRYFYDASLDDKGLPLEVLGMIRELTNTGLGVDMSGNLMAGAIDPKLEGGSPFRYLT